MDCLTSAFQKCNDSELSSAQQSAFCFAPKTILWRLTLLDWYGMMRCSISHDNKETMPIPGLADGVPF